MLDRSPCIGCDRENKPKGTCSTNCLPLARYQEVLEQGGPPLLHSVDPLDAVALPAGRRSSKIQIRRKEQKAMLPVQIHDEGICKQCNERPADHPVRKDWCLACVSAAMNEARRKKRFEKAQGAICATEGCNEPGQFELLATGEWYCSKSHKGKAYNVMRKEIESQEFEAPAASATPDIEPDSSDGQVVRLDFNEHPDMLAWLKRLAAEQFRTVESQVFYFLSQKQGYRQFVKAKK